MFTFQQKHSIDFYRQIQRKPNLPITQQNMIMRKIIMKILYRLHQGLKQRSLQTASTRKREEDNHVFLHCCESVHILSVPCRIFHQIFL